MKVLKQVIKSKSDTRIYKSIELQNQMQCVIISDPEAKKSSAALSIQVGSFQDPIEAQGIAHYLEHMLFMGTKKYPDENQYSEEISKHSGESNAYTDQNETNYHFQVACPAFRHVLDMFAQFFIAPTMNESSSERQLEAVHSEHSKNIQQDTWRKFQLLKFSSLPNEPFNKFSTGDKNSLNDPNIRNILLEFYNKYYSSNLMKLVVYSNENVDEMANYIQQLFSPVPNKSLVQFRLANPPFNQSVLNNIYKIVPIKNKKIIEYMWMVPDQEAHYRNSPGEYISFLIGHEGENSLLSLLIREGLAYELSAGSSNQYHSYTEFNVNITLTDKGFQNHKLVSEYLFYYIEMLKNKGIQEWIFKEIQHIRSSKFDTMGMNHGMSFVSKLAKKMQSVPSQEIMIKDYLMEKWKPELILQYLEQMKPQHLRVNISAPAYKGKTDKVQPIYGTEYSVELLQSITPRPCEVDVPPPNIFFADNMDLIVQTGKQYPEEIGNNQRLRSFFKADHRFNLPKGQIQLRLCYKNSGSVRDDVEKNLYLQLLKNHLREIDYMAETAYIETTLTFSAFGLDLQIKGFNDSIVKFAILYLRKIIDFKPNNVQQFQDLKIKKILSYQNFFKDMPYKQAYDYHLLTIRDGLDNDPLEKLKQAKFVTFQDMCAFSDRWKSSLYGELYIAGNFTKQIALNISNQIEVEMEKCSKILLTSQIRALRGVDLEPGKILVVENDIRNKKETNSCLIRYYQTQKTSVRNKIMQDLTVNYLSEPTFNYLRTQQALGYVVACVSIDSRGMLGISFLVQSSVKASHQLATYVDKLIVILNDKVSTLTEQQFKTIRDSLLVSRSQKPKTLSDQTAKFWQQIVKHSYIFNRQQQQLEVIPTLTLAQFREFYNNTINIKPKSFQTHLTSECHKEGNITLREGRLDNIEKVENIEEFKKRSGLFPDYYAHK